MKFARAYLSINNDARAGKLGNAAEFYGDSEVYGEPVRDREDKQRPPLKVRAYRKSSNQEAGGDKADIVPSCKPRWRRVQMGLRMELCANGGGLAEQVGMDGLTFAGDEKGIGKSGARALKFIERVLRPSYVNSGHLASGGGLLLPSSGIRSFRPESAVPLTPRRSISTRDYFPSTFSAISPGNFAAVIRLQRCARIYLLL